MRPVTLNPSDLQGSLREIERASHESDLTEIGKAFSITGTFTPTFTLNVTSPTLANIANVIATLLDTIQKGGTTRTQ